MDGRWSRRQEEMRTSVLIRTAIVGGLFLCLPPNQPLDAQESAARPHVAVRAPLAAPVGDPPQSFEVYLREHPEAEYQREEALGWYHRYGPRERLKDHTLAMVRYHPGNLHILWQNASAFYADPAYR